MGIDISQLKETAKKNPVMAAVLSIAGDDPKRLSIIAEVMAQELLDIDAKRTSEAVGTYTEEPPSDMLAAYTMMRTKLKETEAEHAKAEKRLPHHDWLDWYSAYMSGRTAGLHQASAAITADMYVRWLLKKVSEAESKPTPAPVQSTVTPEEKAQTEKIIDSGMTGDDDSRDNN